MLLRTVLHRGRRRTALGLGVVDGWCRRLARGSPRWFVVLFAAWMLVGTGLLLAIVVYSVWML